MMLKTSYDIPISSVSWTLAIKKADPGGLRIQVQDPDYCGGASYLGDSYPALV